MKAIIFAILFSLSIVANANEADIYMDNFQCIQGQSWSTCLYDASVQADKKMHKVVKELGSCLEKSKQKKEDPKASLNKEQKAFMKYLDSQQSYLPENGPHRVQSANTARLNLILQRTDTLIDSLNFCSDVVLLN